MTYIDATHVAAELKRRLVAQFQGVKFSVRRGHGSGCAYITVSWTDGPDEDQVKEITRTMEGSRWDGFNETYNETANQVEVTIDGKRVTGRPVVNGISARRSVSGEAALEAEALWSAAHDGAEVPRAMVDGFSCENEWIADGWGPNQVLQIAHAIVLPKHWAKQQKAAETAPPAKRARTKAAKPDAAQDPQPTASDDAPAPDDRRPVVITHSQERGIHVTGTRRRDGIAGIMRAAGFDWHRKPNFWYLPDTEDTANADRIDEVRAALQQAGITFDGEQPAPAAPDAEGPATAAVEPAPAPVPATPAPPTRQRSTPSGSTYEDAVLADVGDYIKDAPGIGAHTAAAATEVIGEKLRSGVIRRDRLSRALPAVTAAVTAKAVRDMRAQGLTHEQIKQRLESKRADALQARNLGRVTVAEAMIAAHAGIVADEEARTLPAAAAPTPELEPVPPALALTAAPAAAPAVAVPEEYRRVPLTPEAVDAWDGPAGTAWRAGVDAALTYAALLHG